MLQQRITVENAVGTPIYEGDWQAYQEALFNDSVMNRLIAVDNDIINPCTVTVELKNIRGTIGRAEKPSILLRRPRLTPTA
jgi:hypothetical protein